MPSSRRIVASSQGRQVGAPWIFADDWCWFDDHQRQNTNSMKTCSDITHANIIGPYVVRCCSHRMKMFRRSLSTPSVKYQSHAVGSGPAPQTHLLAAGHRRLPSVRVYCARTWLGDWNRVQTRGVRPVASQTQAGTAADS